MQTDETGLTKPAPERPSGAVTGTAPAIAPGIARGALLIAGLTLLSRMLGLVRTLVFSQSVGAGCLGTAYVTANQVPNLIYELAIGGALTSAMVPILARSAQRSWTDPNQRARVAQITSALLTWAVVILVPLMVIIAVTAQPIAELLIPANPNSACSRPDMVAVTRTMLVVFAPQVVLYGLSVVLFGLLQAYRRFTGPTLGPVIANLVMITSYLVFVPLDKGLPLGRTPLVAELVLAVGATLNIGALVVTAVPPTWRLHLRFRPTLHFPPGVMRLAGGLAFVGVLEFLAMDLVGVVTIGLANGHGDTGALVMFNYVGMVFQAVSAVLAWSIVTSAFPVLSATEGDTFDRTCAGSTRAVLLVSALGTAVIAAVSVPAAHILAKQPSQVPELIQGFALIAPGVIGGGVITNLSRVMFALGRLKVAAAGLAGAPLLQLVLSVAFVDAVPAHLVVAALSVANSVSLLVVAVPMVFATRRIRGSAAVRGVGHATFASLVAGCVGAAVGVAATLAVPVGRKMIDAGSGALAAIIAIAAFAVAAYLLDRGDLKTVARRAGRIAKFRR